MDKYLKQKEHAGIQNKSALVSLNGMYIARYVVVLYYLHFYIV